MALRTRLLMMESVNEIGDKCMPLCVLLTDTHENALLITPTFEPTNKGAENRQ